MRNEKLEINLILLIALHICVNTVAENEEPVEKIFGYVSLLLWEKVSGKCLTDEESYHHF